MVLIALAAAPSWSAEPPLPPSGEAAEQVEVPNTWYAMSLTRAANNAVVTHYWSHDRKFRSETVVAGHRVVTIVNGKDYYALDPVAGVGLRIDRSPRAIADDAANERPFATDWEEMKKKGAEKGAESTCGENKCGENKCGGEKK